jgi:hypothetical protein
VFEFLGVQLGCEGFFWMPRESVDYGEMYRILGSSGKYEGVLGLRETPWSFARLEAKWD